MAYVKKEGYERCPLKKRPYEVVNNEWENYTRDGEVTKLKTEPQDLSLKAFTCETPPPSPEEKYGNNKSVAEPLNSPYSPSSSYCYGNQRENLPFYPYFPLHVPYYPPQVQGTDIKIPVPHYPSSSPYYAHQPHHYTQFDTPLSPQRSPPIAMEPSSILKENNRLSLDAPLPIPEEAKSRECLRFKCENCQKSYSTLAGLTKHKQFHNCVSEHPKSFSCKHCDKHYTSLGALKMHIRTHTLPCKCHLCGKAFSRPWLLQGHIRTHTGEKPFSCPQCHRAFADRSNLRAHLQTHSEVKKYCCKSCGKTFSRLSLLVKHQESLCGSSGDQS